MIAIINPFAFIDPSKGYEKPEGNVTKERKKPNLSPLNMKNLG